MIRVFLSAGPAEYAHLAALLSADAEVVSDEPAADVVVAVPDAEGELPARLVSENAPPVIVIANLRRPEWPNVLPGHVTSAELAAALQAVQAGLIVTHPDLLREAQRQEQEPLLTPREIEVLSRVAEGHPNKIIAHELGISDHTVKFHVAQILSKLRAGTRTEAVTAGLRLGIVHL